MLDRASQDRIGSGFAEAEIEDQDALRNLEEGSVAGWDVSEQQPFFDLLRAHLQEGLFADPAYGGNRDTLGWRVLQESGSTTPLRRISPRIRNQGRPDSSRWRTLPPNCRLSGRSHRSSSSIRSAGPQNQRRTRTSFWSAAASGASSRRWPGRVEGRGSRPARGGGSRIFGRTTGRHLLLPGRIGTEVQGGDAPLATKRLRTEPRADLLSRPDGERRRGIGGPLPGPGSAAFRPQPAAPLARWNAGAESDPRGMHRRRLAGELRRAAPWFDKVERIVGIGGDEDNAFLPHDEPYPLPPTRPFRMGELFTEAARGMGLHPHALQDDDAGLPRLPEMTYTAWNNGFGSWTGDKWHPGLTSVRALATGNFDLRTHCRVTRVATDAEGRARGVEYADALGRPRVQGPEP